MKMNKKIFLPVLAVALMLAGNLLSSCSSNNEIQKRVNADITSTVSFTSASEADVK